MVVRNITEADVDQVFALEQAIFSSPWTRTAIMTEVISPKCHYKVIDRDGEILGYAGLWKVIDEGHITNIAVKEGYRNKGLGRMLIEALVEECRKLDVDRYTLEVRVSNEPAIALYKSLGFETAGVRKNFYDKPKEDALIMWKELSDV